MLNPQELRDKTFEKAVFGGYDMAAVDDFLAAVAEDYSAVFKEVSVLKAKMKVLVDKIEEYRGSESAMNKTLLTAQRVSAEIEDEAREKSEAMLRNAEETAAKLMRDAHDEIANEEERLLQAKRSTAEFIERMRVVCTKQMDFLDALGELKLVSSEPSREIPAIQPDPEPEFEPEPEEEILPPDELFTEEFDEEIDESGEWDTVRSIEDSVAKLSDEPEIDVSPELEYQEIDESEPTRLFNIGDTATRPKFNFENLRFGDNYSDDK